MNDLLADAATRAIRYLDSVGERPVAPSPAAVQALRGFDQPLPDESCSPSETLRQLDELGSPATTAMAGPRFFGFVIGGTLPVTLAANWLAGAWDQNTGLYRPTPGTSFLEQVSLRWLLEAGQANDVTLAETLRGHRDEMALAASANANLNLNLSGVLGSGSRHNNIDDYLEGRCA